MTDSEATLDQLKGLVLTFSKERDWEQFHHPKDLGLALASEVGELLDLFRFKSDTQILDPTARDPIAHEMADCLWALLRLADVMGIDLASSLEEKVRLAGIKYPIDRSFGRSDKYTVYREANGRLE